MKIKLLIIGLLVSVFAVARNVRSGDTRYFKGTSSLPAFVYNNTGMVFGVSDPAMNSETAKKQAVTRAIFLYALQKNVHLRMLSDFYSKNEPQTNTYDTKREKCLTLVNINIPPVTYKYDIVDEFVSDRGETFVYLKVCDDADESMTLSANCDFMSSYDMESHESSDYKVLTTLSVQNDNVCDTMDYSFKGKLDNPIISSKYRDHDKCYYKQAYWYYDEGTINTDINSYTLKDAFWCAFIESLCEGFIYMVSDEAVVKNINEVYNNVNQSLSRELVRNRVSCFPTIYGVKDNRLSIGWKINTFN